MENFILSSFDGDHTLYPATLDIAKSIFQDYHANLGISKNLIDLKNQKKNIRSKDSFIQILNNILSKDIGQQASKTIQVTEDIRQELVLYCFHKKIPIQPQITVYDFFNQGNPHDLSFIKNNENYMDCVFIYQDEMDVLHQYHVISNGIWKESASEIAKIRYILEFVQKCCHRDQKFSIVQLKDIYS